MAKVRINEGIDYYEILGVNKDSSEEELKQAYRKRAFETHPDTGKDKSGEEFKRVNEAYEVLSNQDIRDRYDSIRSSGSYSKKPGKNKKTWGDSFEENFRNFYWDIFREDWDARAPTPEEQREDYERKERREKEYAEKEAGRKARRDREVNKLWREGINKIIPYIIRFPDLKLSFYNDNWFKENFASMYERDGSLFCEDVGIFNRLVNDLRGTSGKELYKILLETRHGYLSDCEARIPLETPQLSGLEILVSKRIPTKLRGGVLDFEAPTTIRLDVPSSIWAPATLPRDFDKPEESLMRTCNFIANLSEKIRQGDYAIKFSRKLPKKHEIKVSLGEYANYPPGFWIESLELRGEKVIQDGEVVDLPSNLDQISERDINPVRILKV
jgi:curved DNA-binding protein CbpA